MAQAQQRKPTAPSHEKFAACVHCGLCTSACPTYLELGAEPDGPRGRIHLMRSVAEGQFEWSADVVRHLDLCLECRACETACPSGVEYSHLLEWAREDIAHNYKPPMGQRVRQGLLKGILRDRLFPYPHRVERLLWPARILQRLGGLDARAVETETLRHERDNTDPTGPIPAGNALGRLLQRLPGLGRWFSMLPPLPDSDLQDDLADIVPAYGTKRYRVGFMTGCIASVLFSPTNLATIQVLARNGCEVVIPRQQGCCGALHLHTGDPQTTRRFAQANLDVFRDQRLDAIITNSAGCGSTLKEYGHVLADDDEYAADAAGFSAQVKDISEFLAGIPLRPPTHTLRRRVTYHDACHLLHGQGVQAEPRTLLEQIPGIDLVPLADSELCCGSAGMYNLLEPGMAGKLQENKIQRILETGAEIVATGNPGCLMQIAQGLRSRGKPVRVVHPIELLAEAYGDGLGNPAV